MKPPQSSLLKKSAACFLGIAILISAQAAQAAVKNLKDPPFSAVGDGLVDDRPALASALSSLTTGDILVVPPGNYRIVLTGSTLQVPAGASILGQREKSVLLLENNGSTAYRELLRPAGSNVTIEGLTIQRNANFPIVALPLFGYGNLSNYTLKNCTINGRCDLYSNYFHCFQIGKDTVTAVTLSELTITKCSYGLFGANTAIGTLDGILVTNCQFDQNYATDLEFNLPNGTCKNVTITDCYFSNNQATASSAGWAVGLARIDTATVMDCYIRNYNRAGIHVESRSHDVVLSGNILKGTATVGDNPIIILNGSYDVSIDRNVIDTRDNPTTAFCVLVTAGGATATLPTNVSVTNNLVVKSATTRDWYLQPGFGPAPTGNIVTP